MIFSILMFVLSIVALWQVFVKAGEPGWKSIIPVYNIYTQYKVAGKKNLGIAALIITAVSAVLSIPLFVLSGYILVSPTNPGMGISISYLLIFIAIVGMIIALFVLGILRDIAMARAFGHGVGFAIGLILVPGIFIPILAFGKSVYVLNDKADDYIIEVTRGGFYASQPKEDRKEESTKN